MLFPALTGVGLMALEFCTVKFVSTIILGEDGPLLGITDTTSVGSILEAQKIQIWWAELGQGGRCCQSRTKSATELLFSLESAHTWVVSMGPVEFWKMKLSPKDSGRRMMIYRKSRYTLTQTQTVCQCALAPSSRSASAPSTAPSRSFKLYLGRSGFPLHLF